MRLPKSYEPTEYEADIYALWEKQEAFVPKNRGGEGYFSMVMPPPNANANLHIGFGLTVAIHDVVTRYHRMLGKKTLMVPGADHAGFETQVVYEKRLAKEGKSRFDFSREELYKQVWEFVESNKHNFQSQMRAMGASCDWTRFTYTLDKKVVEQAYSTFQKMWDEDLIYRGKRIVNFCTFHGTGFSDIEVVHEEEDSNLWHVAYPLANGNGEIIVATTRPETMLGDTAVAVHPDDERYKALVGKRVIVPISNREVPIVADSVIEQEFGSGAVKVTPAHDANDYEIAKRNSLPIIDIITPEGKISHQAPKDFQDLTVTEARKRVVEELELLGYLRDTVKYTHTVGKCYKCGTTIEPLLRKQWFVNMKPLAAEALKAVNADKITFYPKSKKKQLIAYLENIQDWNISRQIAWGIPIPAFQNVDDEFDWIFDTRVDKETLKVDGKTYQRDPDVFDTWFSSGSWPYVTLDYPEGDDYKDFYPLSLMETAGEILYQWVARMIMMGCYTTGEIPFKEVYIHGLILAEGGAKMSKSLGNVVDAMEIIGSHGSDALRMGLINGRIPAVNRGYDPRKVEEARNFGNKIWNIARFIENQVGDDHKLRANADPKSAADHWVLHQLNRAIKDIAKAIEDYRLSEAYEFLYQFVWHDFADWYIEASKTETNTGLLAYVLEATLKLAHPFAPFVTETIWQTLAWEDSSSMLATSLWPTPVKVDSKEVKKFEAAVSVVTEARRIINTLGVNKPTLYHQNVVEIAEQADLITSLARLSGVREGEIDGLRLTGTGYAAWLDIDSQIQINYVNRLKDQAAARLESITRLEARLASKAYTDRAPVKIVNQTRQQLAEEITLLAGIKQEISGFESGISEE